MSIATRQDWLTERASAIGASEMAALFGEGFETPMELYARKIGALPPIDETEAMEVGTLMQSTIATMLERRTSFHVVEAPQTEFLRHPDYPFIGCTPDAYVFCEQRGRGIGEWKNVGHYNAAEWKEGLPLRVQVQTQGQMAVTGCEWGVAAALLGGNKFVWRIVERDDKFIAVLIRQCKEFWRRVVERDPPPADGDERTKRALFAMHPDDNGDTVALPAEVYESMADEIASLDAAISLAETRKTELQNKIRAALGDATYGVLPDGSGWSWKTQDRAAYEVQASKSRVLRRTKATKGKK